jgi:hypothetical protein
VSDAAGAGWRRRHGPWREQALAGSRPLIARLRCDVSYCSPWQGRSFLPPPAARRR